MTTLTLRLALVVRSQQTLHYYRNRPATSTFCLSMQRIADPTCVTYGLDQFYFTNFVRVVRFRSSHRVDSDLTLAVMMVPCFQNSCYNLYTYRDIFTLNSDIYIYAQFLFSNIIKPLHHLLYSHIFSRPPRLCRVKPLMLIGDYYFKEFVPTNVKLSFNKST